MSDPYLGQIIAFAGNYVPRGWAACDGSLMQISTNTALFSLLGTTYGGNGSTTFALPDLRGRMIVGSGTGPGLETVTPGQQGGNTSVTLNISQMPAHSHALNASDQEASAPTAQGNYLPSNPDERGSTNIYAGPPQSGLQPMAPPTIGQTGGSQPVTTQSPFTCIGYIIAVQGIYPPRN